MALATLNDVFFLAVARNAGCVFKYRDGERWREVGSRELYSKVVSTARTLASWGIRKGDRCAILSENRPEWAIADFATFSFGAVVVPIYPTLTAEQIGWLLRDSGARVLFLSTAAQLQKVQEVRAQTPVEKIVLMDDPGDLPEGVISMASIMQSGPTENGPIFDATARSIAPDDVATIIYTSGTTGQQKGAILTHHNLASNVSTSLEEYPLDCESYVSFLPLSHVTARHVDYLAYYRGITIAYQPDINKLLDSVQEIRPTLFVAIPRVYEKVRQSVERKASQGIKRAIYRWAMKVGRAHRDTVLRGRTPSSLPWKLADRLIYSKVREALGGQVRYFISGGAPLGRELAEWYADIGIRIHEGYGLTETSPVIAVNSPAHHRLGTVGRPLSNVEVRIADDGEILVRGPSVFKGYWNRPEETANAFEGDWFKTGDIGNLDADGYLSITDRKKDLIKTSGGKFIAPQPIESALKNHELISEAAVLGDRRKYAVALLRPDFDALELWAKQMGIGFQNHQQLIGNSQVQALYQTLLNDVNAKLAQFEKMKKFLLIADDFTIANGFLTPTLKLRRRVIEERYKQQIEELYSDAAPVP